MEVANEQTQETTAVIEPKSEIQTGDSLENSPRMVSKNTQNGDQSKETKADPKTNLETPDKILPKKVDTIQLNGPNNDKIDATTEKTAVVETPTDTPTKSSTETNGGTSTPVGGSPIPVKDEKNIAKNSSNKSVQTSGEVATGKKSKKKDAASAEEKKLVDLLVHVFDGLDTPEKKMEALAKKYIQLAADMKTAETKLEDAENKHREVRKEKDQIQSDFGKVNMARTKLESLCRELQKQNKIIKDEIQKRADEEDRKRKDLSQKFQTTINDITTQMGDNHKRNQQLKQDNTELAQKLKGLVEQYEVREQHIEKVLKAKQLELQLCEAKLQQQNLILQEERQNNLKEKHALLQESLDQKKKVEMLVKQEAELKSQLTMYTVKFVEFQSTLTKSNEVFATFKKEMDKMTKTIRKLEKESNMWKSRYENTNVSLVQMVEERTQKDGEISTQKGKIDKLEKLCRALQLERRKLKKELEQFEKDKSPDSKTSEQAAGQPTGKEDESRDESASSTPDVVCPPSSPDVGCPSPSPNAGAAVENTSEATADVCQEKSEPTAQPVTGDNSSIDENLKSNPEPSIESETRKHSIEPVLKSEQEEEKQNSSD